MVNARIEHVAIRGISAAVPEQIRSLDELARQFGAEEVRKISESTGVSNVHISPEGQCASDLCAVAADKLLKELGWEPSSIGLLIVVTQMPDYVLPSTGCVLHARLGLSKSAFTVDISQGCSGYVAGLWTAAAFLSQLNPGRALLLVGDTISKIVSPEDRATSVLFGDAGTATALERVPGAAPLLFAGGADGTGAEHLIVSTGGFRRPHPLAPAPSTNSPWGLGSLAMNGPEVFAFTSREVTKLVAELLAESAWAMDEVDQVVFHQANKFLLDHLRKKLKIPADKFPISLDRFGNTSSASIPLTLANNRGIIPKTNKTLLAGFGVGFSWAGCACNLQDTLILPVTTSNAKSLPLGA